jgi:hypothetical protein
MTVGSWDATRLVLLCALHQDTSDGELQMLASQSLIEYRQIPTGKGEGGLVMSRKETVIAVRMEEKMMRDE